MPKATKQPGRKRVPYQRCDCGQSASVRMLAQIYIAGQALGQRQATQAADARTYLHDSDLRRIALPLCPACQALEIQACREHNQPLPRFEPL